MSRAMKDSGIEWIGQIPKNYNVMRCKYISKFLNGYAFDSSDLKVDFTYSVIRIGDIKDGGIDTINCQGINNNAGLSKYQIKENDILLAMSGATVGKVGIVKNIEQSYINQRVGIIRANQAKFLFYCLYTKQFIEYIILKANGSAQPNVSGGMYGEYKIPFPSIDEQNKIAAYLDKKCGEIDAITAKIQEQITTLEEYKKSVISEAVTKGLNPNALMKDSGIEWIGQIPVNWEVDKFKYHLQRKEVKNKPELQVLSLYRELGIIPKDSRDDNHNVTSEDTSKYKYVKIGCFIVNKMKAWQGSVGVSDYEGIVSPAYYVYEFSDNKFNNRYFHYLLRGCYKDEFMRVSGGIRVGQWDLPADKLENILVVIPSPTEQQEIADYLDSQCFQVEEAIADKQKQIETLEEYKKTLIYEYVTGKKEVS